MDKCPIPNHRLLDNLKDSSGFQGSPILFPFQRIFLVVWRILKILCHLWRILSGFSKDLIASVRIFGIVLELFLLLGQFEGLAGIFKGSLRHFEGFFWFFRGFLRIFDPFLILRLWLSFWRIFWDPILDVSTFLAISNDLFYNPEGFFAIFKRYL